MIVFGLLLFILLQLLFTKWPIMDNVEIESADEEMPAQTGRRYSPVTSHERPVIQMSTFETGSPSAIKLKYFL